MNGAPIPDVAPKIEPTGDIAAEAAKAADVAKARQIGELKRVQAAAEAQEAAQNAENPPLQKEPAMGPATGSLVKDFVGRMESKKTNKVEMRQSNDLPLNEPQNPPVAGPDSGDGESRQPGQEPTVEAGSGEPSAAGSSVEGGQATGGGTPPLSTEVPAQGQAEPTADEKTNKAAKELLMKDDNAKAYLESLDVTNLENLNIAEEVDRLGDKQKRTPQEEAIFQRLQEIRGRALRQEAQAKLDELNKNPSVDKNSPEYLEAKQQFEDHAPDAERHYVREAIRQDKGLSKMFRDNNYDLEDFNMQQAIHDEGDSPLGKRLQAINGRGQIAVLEDGDDYDATPEQRADRMRKIAKAGEHERGFFRGGLDKVSDVIAQFSGAEIRDAFNQAKGWKQTIKAKQAELKKLRKDPNHDTKREEELNNDIDYAKHLRAEALKEAIGKRGLKILFILFLLMSAAIVVGPAILPAKLMEWGGKGAGH